MIEIGLKHRGIDGYLTENGLCQSLVKMVQNYKVVTLCVSIRFHNSS